MSVSAHVTVHLKKALRIPLDYCIVNVRSESLTSQSSSLKPLYASEKAVISVGHTNVKSCTCERMQS